MKLTFITGNQNKFQEVKQIIPYLEQLDLDLTEIQSLDPHEIIKHKLQEAQKHKPENIVVEDQYINVHCLKGLPGPFIKWFLKTLDLNGIAELVHKYPNHNATASVIIGYLKSQNDISYFEGSIEGKIVKPRGDNGFGWDPIFEEIKSGKTFAEMTPKEKNQISMRKIAFQKLKNYLRKKLEVHSLKLTQC